MNGNPRRAKQSLLDTKEPYTPKFQIANIETLISKKARYQTIPFLREQCVLENPYFLAFAETNLTDTIKDAEFDIKGYSHVTSHRKNREGGGVIMYINNDLAYKTLISDSDKMCSIVAVYIYQLNLIVFMVYRPPPTYKNNSIYNGKILEQSFKSIVIDNIYKAMNGYEAPVPDIILAGDFNFPKAIWRHGIGEAFGQTISEKNSLQQLIEVAGHLNLLQKVTFGTRETRSGKRNTLELIFTNNHELISNIYSEYSKLTDHRYIICETSHNFTLNKQKLGEPQETNLASYNYKKAEWTALKNKLKEIYWSEILEGKTSDEKIKIILELVSKAVEEHCPKFRHQRGIAKKNIPRDRRILHRKRKKLKSKLKKENISNDQKNDIEKNIADLDTELLNSYQNERINEELRALDNMKTNPKHFFAYAKKHLKTNSSIGPFRLDNELITDLVGISKKLSEQYTHSFSEPALNQSIGDPKKFFSTTDAKNNNLLSDIAFSREMIVNEIGNIKNNSAPGPDYFSVMLLQQCAEELSEPLYLLWRHSLDTGDIASLLKHAIICPILKANAQKCLPKSYRPVSLTSHITKVFERVIRASIVKHLEENNLLPKNQHGFIAGRSTLSQLLNQIEQLIRSWEEGKATDTIYLDFAKAFDKVDHNILCRKLKHLGITGKVGIWIHKFLTGRYQQVSANGVLSDPAPVISGVPQGTVLGPILFVIMIDDLDCELIHAISSKYADDTRVTAKIAGPDDAKNFQLELNNKIYTWGPANNMALNGDKFEHLSVGKNLHLEKSTYTDPNGNIIKEKNEINDLGVTISNDLTWTTHISEVVSRARVMAAWVLRTFSTRDKTAMITMWNTRIRPILDYCSPLWSPCPSNYKNIDLLEETQRSFTRSINGTKGLNYAQRLKFSKLYSVQRRHERYKIIYIYKIKENKVPNISSTHGIQFYLNKRYGCMSKMPSYPLHHNLAVTARNSSFALTATSLWNCLPKHIRNISGLSVEAFKRRLDWVLRLYPDEPRCSATGLYVDEHGRTSNSIVDITRNKDVRQRVAKYHTHC